MASESEIMNSVFDSASNTLKTSGAAVGGATAGTSTNVVGGVYNTTAPTYTNGQATQAQSDSKGSLKTAIMDSNGSTQAAVSPSWVDNLSNTSSGLNVYSRGATYNGSTWDRVRGNEETTLLASAARTTTQTGSDLTNYLGNTSLIVVLDMTTVGTGSVTLSIEGKDSASGKYYTILSGAAVTTNSTNRYRVSPDLAAVANSVAQDVLPRVFRITVTANNANSATYSVGYCLVGR